MVKGHTRTVISVKLSYQVAMNCNGQRLRLFVGTPDRISSPRTVPRTPHDAQNIVIIWSMNLPSLSSNTQTTLIHSRIPEDGKASRLMDNRSENSSDGYRIFCTYFSLNRAAIAFMIEKW
jgi:hypothetical protein